MSNPEFLVFYSEQRRIVHQRFFRKSAENFEPSQPVGKYRLKCLTNTVMVSETITRLFQSTEAKMFLCVNLFVTPPFRHIYTRLHSCVSTDAVPEFRIGYAYLGS